MRFKYDPSEFVLSVYVNHDEFQLAATSNKKEYRVCVRQFESVNDINIFINEFVKFTRDILGATFPDERIKDIVVFSTLNYMGFSWTSLLDPEKHYESFNFLDSVLSYGANEIRTSKKLKNDVQPSIMDVLSEEDLAKITLARVLVNSIENPVIWRSKPKSDKNKVKVEFQLKKLRNKINTFEKKYGFSSEEMYKFYNDDELPDAEMEAWKSAYQQYKIIQMSIDKSDLVTELVQKWRKSFD